MVTDSTINHIPSIQILDYNVVCESPGFIRGKIGSTSVLVGYQCTGMFCTGFEYNGTTTKLGQFQFTCHEDDTFFPPSSRGYVYMFDALISADFSTPIDTDCGECIAPVPHGYQSDPVTYCAGICYIVYRFY